MSCETIRTELVAYRDGELSNGERARVAAHLRTCPTCAQEEVQLARVSQLLTTLERVTPSPDFETTFWRRLEQENPVEQESWLVRWWREWLGGWQWAPALAAAASFLILFSYIFSDRLVTTIPPVPPQEEVPSQLANQPDLFVHYPIIANLDRFAHFDEIAALQSRPEPESELASEEELPPKLLENPSFFVHYPILQRMDELQNLEAVLGDPSDKDKQRRG
jgi:hypothetical protein